MHAKLIYTEKKKLCCSKAYALEHGILRNPYQLEGYWCIRYARDKDEIWQFEKDEAVDIKLEGRLIVNDIDAMRTTVLGDMGITFLPSFCAKKKSIRAI
jgi:DNA-binding transcriptional LysR family regulator